MKQVYGSLMSTLVSVLFLGVFFLGNQEEAKAQCTSVTFVSCPSDTILYPPFPPEICDALVVLNPPTAVAAPAACGTPTVTAIAGITASGTYPVGTYTIVWVASAPGVPTSGWDTCTYNLTIADTVRPRLTNCPGDIVIDQENDTCGAHATWVAPTATDACGVTMTSNFNSGDFFPVGVTTVSYIAEDPSGNTNICSFTITVNDTSAPVITFCPGDTTINLTAADACPLPVTLQQIVAEDDCAITYSWAYTGVTVGSGTGTDASGIFNVGVTTVTFTVDDGTNTTTCSFDVTVNDVVDPTINCGSTVTGNADAGLCSTTLSTTITGSDNCTYTITNDYNAQTSTDASLSFSDVFPVGTTSVTFTVTDGVGNTSTCSLDFVVNDNQDPVITVCPADATIFVDAVCSETLPDYTGGVTATDNCAVASVTQSPVAGTSYTNGDVITVTYTVTDVNGNTTTCSNVVTFTDNTPPTFDACPTSQTVGNDAGNCDYVYTFSLPTASDNCDVSVDVTQTAGPASPATLAVGTTTTFTFVATDDNGNTASCSYTITVEDQEDPVITVCAADATVTLDATCDGLLPDLTASVIYTDNCGATIAQSPLAGTPYNGAQDVIVTFTVSDAAGNTATCSATVTFEDTQAPVVSCPAPQTINTSDDGTGDCSAFVNLPSLTITENCDFSIVSFVVNNGDTLADFNQSPFNIAPGPVAFNFNASYALGTNTIILNVTDASGNTASCSHDVIVVDDEDPTITCPGDITQGNDLDTCGAVVSFTVTASDNCSYVITNDYNAQAANNTSLSFSDYFVVGTTTVVFTVTDTAGNTATCSLDVTVNDVQGPDLTCPQNIETNTINSLVCYDIVTWTPPIPDDNCPGLVTLTQTTSWPNPGLYAANGWKDPYVVAYVAADAAGNTSTCSFTITIFDTVAPYFLNCPADVTIPADPAGCNNEYIWTPPTGVDNCAGLVVTASHAPGYTFQVGTTRVWYAAIDSSGNTDTCEFFVTVEDVIPPVLTCVGDTTIPNDLGACGALYYFDLPGIEDECDTVATTLRSTVKKYIFDGTDQTSTCVAVPDLNVYMIPGTAAVGDVTVNVYHRGDINQPEEYFDVFDEAGNNLGVTNFGSQCDPVYTVTTFVISEATFNTYASDGVVEFNLVPFPGTINPVNNWCLNDNQDAYVEVVLNENNLTLVQTAGLASGNLFPVGVTTQVFEVTDASGNVTTCTWDVTVEDVEAPVVVCLPYSGTTSEVVVNGTFESGDFTGWTTTELTNPYIPWLVDVQGTGAGSFFTPELPSSGSYLAFNGFDGNGPGFFTLSQDVTLPASGILTLSWDHYIQWELATFGATTERILSVQIRDLANNPLDTIYNFVLNPGTVGNTGWMTNTADLSAYAGQTIRLYFEEFVSEDFTGPAEIGFDNISIAETVVLGRTDTTFFNDPGLCSATISLPVVFNTDNCGIASVVNDYNGTDDASDTYPVGTTTVIYTVTDIHGNVSTCSFDVIVIDNEAPVVTCQNTNVFLDAAGQGSITTADVVQFVDDNCGIASIVQSQNNFTCANVGVNTIITTVTDVNGNTSTCSSVVTVFDAIAPTALCQNITVQLDATGNASITANDIDNGSFDNCGIASLVASQTAFTCGDLGIVPVTLTVTDVNGNVSQCVALVTVEDNVAPTALCQDVTIFLDATGNASITTADIDAGSTDNCTIVDISLSQTAFDCGDVGDNTVVLSVTDQSGNVSTCSATVTVVDAIAPTAICQNAVVFLDATGNGSVTVADINNGSFDNCGIASITLSQTAFDCSHVGVVTITMTVTDVNGLVSNCTADVTVIDNVPPVALCQNITVQLPATSPATYNLSTPTQEITLSGQNFSFSFAGVPTPSSDAVVTLYVRGDYGSSVEYADLFDENGNLLTTNFGGLSDCSPSYVAATVTVPQATVQAWAADGTINFTVDNTSAVNSFCSTEDNYIEISYDYEPATMVSIVAADIDGGSTDACGIATLVASQTDFDCNDLGPNLVTLTVTDVNGNVSQCVALVTVEDNVAPIAFCQDITVYLDINGDVSITATDVDNGSSDNCTIVDYAIDIEDFDCSNVGPNNVTLTVTDQSGNIGQCVAVVTVLDTTRPNIVCPPNFIANNSFGLCGNAIQGFQLAQLTDNCGIQSVVNDWTVNGANASAFYPVGVTTVTWLATDVNGNTATCSATVTINDFERPTINVPSNIVVNNDPGVCGAVVNFTVNYFENCPNDSFVQTSGLPSGSVFPVGTTVNSYFAIDEAGNTNSASFTVTVRDTEAPVFSNCSANITVPNGPGECGAQVFYVTPTASDNCGATVTLVGLGSGAFFPVGTSTETYVAVDAAGNSVSCVFTVTVEDVENPVITCLPDIVVSNDPGLCEAVVNFPGILLEEDFESFSTCGTFSTAVCNLTNGWVNDPFDSQSDWLVDVGGTSSSLTGPSTDYVPGTSTGKYLYLETSGTNGQTANLISPALDLTSASYATLSFWYHMYGSTMGTMHVDASIDGGATWTLDIVPSWTDNQNLWQNRVVDMTAFVGNTDVHFRIRGIKGPSFRSDMAVDYFQVFSDAVPGQPAFSDNCPGAVLTQIGGLPSGSSYPVGTNVVTYQVVDASGNIATCSFNVIVNDTEGPVVTCGPDATVNTSDDGTGDCTTTFSADYVISDNCTNDDITVDINITNGGTSIYSSSNVQVGGAYTETYTLELGDNLITYTITDTNGNVTVCSRTITVLDDEAPVIICPADITVSNDPGVCNAAVTVPAPAASDNCAFTVTNDFNGTADASGVYPVGTTAVTFTITDAGNNVSFCTFNVTVEDTEAPVISGCPTDTTLPSDTGLCGALFIFTAPTAADNCPGVTFGQTAGLPSLSIFPVGETVVEYTATDAAGNVTVCSFTVTVVDVEAPTVIDCPGDITVPSDFGLCGAQVFWQDPFAFDNCVDFAWTSNFVSGDTLPVGTTTVVYVATDSAGNTAVCSFNVTVEDVEAPVFTACPADIFSCDPVQSWALPTATDNCAVTSIVGTANPGDTFPVGATTVEYVATDAAGNSTVCSFVVTIWPTPVVSAGADQDVCLNSSVTIGGNPTAGAATAPYNYSWSPAAGLNSTVDANPVATPLVTTTYTVVVVDANGCTASDDVTVTVLPLPTADAGADVAICVGSTTTIGGAPTASGTAGPYTYSWSPATGLSSANAANPAASPAATTTYTVTVTDANGCQSTDEVVVTVNPLPNATITAAGPFCLNDGPQTLTAATAGGSWSGNGITNAAAGTFDPAVAGVGIHQITYEVTDANGCFNSATTLVEVLPLPNSRILPAGPYCENDAPVFLTGLPAINPHTWSGPGIVNAQTGQFDPAVAGAGVHTISYVVTNAVGCTDTATVEITVTGAPAVAITFAGPFCESEPVQTLTANIGGGIWSGPGIIQAQLGQFLPLAASAGTHQIIYEVANAAGCVASDTTFIVVFEVPAITFSTDDASCEDATDGSVNITVSGGTAPYTYSWSNGANSEDLSGVAAGTYTVTVTDANACPQTQSITVGVSVNPVSVAAIVSPANNAATPNGAIDITVNGGVPPYTFVWSNGATTEDLSGLLPGTYELTIIDDAGCSYVFFYQVGARFGVGIDLVDLNKNINLFPNPTSDAINVNIEVGGINAEMTMSVFDMLGRKVYEVNDAFTGMYSHRIEMTNWAAGQYMVRFNINGQMVTKKFVLAR